MYVVNLTEQETVLGIISLQRSRPAGPDVQTKSRANHTREETAEFNFKSTLSKSCWLLAKHQNVRLRASAAGGWERLGNSLCAG